MQRAIGCEYSQIEEEGCHLILSHAATVRRALRNQIIAAHNGKPASSTKAFVRAVREIEHHDDVNSGIFADESGDKKPQKWT